MSPTQNFGLEKLVFFLLAPAPLWVTGVLEPDA